MFCKRAHKLLIFSTLVIVCSLTATAQRNLADYDSTLFIRDTVRPILKRLENLRFTGYMQAQYQVAGSKGAPSYEGGNFQPASNNRFMLRRARVKIDYILPAKGKDFPLALFTFQIDATERAVLVRDMFLRLYEAKGEKLSLTAGLFARPFGYEVNLSSAYRETPERGRMSQILMPTERDLGAMASYESRNRHNHKPLFKFDIGAFNGQGLSGTADFDSYKDLISRFTMKSYEVAKHITVGAGLSLLYGGWRQGSKYSYSLSKSGPVRFLVDSNDANLGRKAPRRYYGADVQVAWKHGWGKTELRGEYWRGTQSGTLTSTVNPGRQPEGANYVRPFDGAFFYLLQNIGNKDWELMVKYDWYDPNREVKAASFAGSNLGEGDIRFDTWGVGVNRYLHDHVKLTAYYAMPVNERVPVAGFTSDLDDNVFTLRLQLRF